MKIRTLLLLVVLGLIAVFSALNWNAFMTPTILSLGFSTVQAPLGLIMLGVLILLTAFFLVFVVYLQTAVLFDTRRQAREMQANRELTEKAETSRFIELRTFMESEMKRQTEQNAASKAAVLTRIDQLDRDVLSAIEQSGNSVSAFVGQLEDRLERGEHGLMPRPT
ncbi:MAG: LapA family protein [Pseudomonadota bacterium]